MNATSMLPWEKKVMKYLDTSKNSVLYRVTPYFAGKELLARGVEIEARGPWKGSMHPRICV